MLLKCLWTLFSIFRCYKLFVRHFSFLFLGKCIFNHFVTGNSPLQLCCDQIKQYLIKRYSGFFSDSQCSISDAHIGLCMDWYSSLLRKWHFMSSAAAVPEGYFHALSFNINEMAWRTVGNITLDIAKLSLYPPVKSLHQGYAGCVCAMHYCLEVRSWDDGMCKHAPVLTLLLDTFVLLTT